MIEDYVLVKVNFRSSPRVVSVSQPLDSFFDHLVTQAADRNPDLTIRIPRSSDPRD